MDESERVPYTALENLQFNLNGFEIKCWNEFDSMRISGNEFDASLTLGNSN